MKIDDDTKEEKTTSQLNQDERDKIEVTRSENNIDNEDEIEGEEKEETNETEDTEEKLEKETDEKDKNISEDETEDDVEDDPVKLKKSIERLKRRIGTKTNNERELQRQLNDLQTKIKALEDEKGEKLLTEEDVETRAKEIAERRKAQDDFDNACIRLQESALKTNESFKEDITELGEDYGAIPPYMIEILDELDRGGEVLNFFIKNPDEYEKIRILKPGRMAAKLKDIDLQLKPKREIKQVSKAPAPIKPINTNNSGDENVTLTGKESMEDWVRKRNQQIAKKRGAA